MAACHFPVSSGSYGVGIRIAFYLQWFGMIATSWTLESDALNLKLVNALTAAAASIGLILNLDRLQPVEKYIVLLLTCGTLYSTVPVYLWRLVTCCRPWWDPQRWTRTKMGWLSRVLTYSMHGALLSLHIWFWCRGVRERREMDPKLDTDTECEQFGFLFAQVRLDDPALVILNIIIHFTILAVGTWVSATRISVFDGCYWNQSQKRRRWRITKDRVLSLRHFQTICDLVVATTVTMAIELVISWNKITRATDLDSAAQLIPPVVTGGFLAHSLCVWAAGPDGDSEDSGSYYCPRAAISNRSGPPRRRRAPGRGRRSSYRRRRRSRGASRMSPDFLDAYPDMFDLSDLSVPPPASLGGYADPHASGYYDMASSYYGVHGGDYVGDELSHVPHVGDDLGHGPPAPPPTTAASHVGSRGASGISGEGFIRL